MEVGFIPNNTAACNPLGIAFDAAGHLYMAIECRRYMGPGSERWESAHRNSVCQWSTWR